MHDIRYSESRDEIYVANPFAQAILTFRGGANGQESPIRMIQGPKTMLRDPDTLEVDEVHNEIIVPGGNEVLIFPLTADGDVAPLRVLRGGTKMGWRSGGGIAVDPVHNFLVVAGTFLSDRTNRNGPDRAPVASLMIFDRLADGEVKPLRVIHGPKSGLHHIRQIQVQPKAGWIVVTDEFDGLIREPEGTFLGVWSINDSGDVPPRWKIEGKASNGMKKPHGIALDAKHKEVVVADMRLNAILTFYFPEIF